MGYAVGSLIYSSVEWNTTPLETKLASLTADELTDITTQLANLATLEAAILTAAGNLDTKEAAVWKRNENEMRDRGNLYQAYRIRLCDFLGVRPGKGISRSDNSVQLVR